MSQQPEHEGGVANIRGKVILSRLESLARKIKLQSGDLPDIDFRVFAPQTAGGPFIIEVSKGRFRRRVAVDLKTVRILNVQPEHFDPNLSRELRNAMLAVARLAAATQPK